MGSAHCGRYRPKAGVITGAITAGRPSYTTPQPRPVASVASCACKSLPLDTPDASQWQLAAGAVPSRHRLHVVTIHRLPEVASVEPDVLTSRAWSRYLGSIPTKKYKQHIACQDKSAPPAECNLDRAPSAFALLGASLLVRAWRVDDAAQTARTRHSPPSRAPALLRSLLGGDGPVLDTLTLADPAVVARNV